MQIFLEDRYTLESLGKELSNIINILESIQVSHVEGMKITFRAIDLDDRETCPADESGNHAAVFISSRIGESASVRAREVAWYFPWLSEPED